MEQEKDSYLGLTGTGDGLYKDNGSRFIAFARPVETAEQAKEFIEALEKEYHDSRHVCWAYRIGVNGEEWRLSDDGEPSGSAGRPIMGQIDSLGLSDTIVAVVRYFGGIKLGIPGLIKAYKTSSADALASAPKGVKFACRTITADFRWEDTDKVLKALEGCTVIERNFDSRCLFRCSVRLSMLEDTVSKLEGAGAVVKETEW